MRGWRVRRFSDAVSWGLRKTGVATKLRGLPKGYARYMLGFPAYWTFYKAIKTWDLKMLAGYVQAWLFGLPILETKSVFHREMARMLLSLTTPSH